MDFNENDYLKKLNEAYLIKIELLKKEIEELKKRLGENKKEC